MSPPAGPPVVELRRCNQNVAVHPPIQELAERLSTYCHTAVGDSACGVRINITPSLLMWLEESRGKKYLISYAGLAPQIARTLREMGHEVAYKGCRPRTLPEPRATKAGQHNPDDELLDFIQQKDRGIIRYSAAGFQLDRLIAQVAEAFPKTGVLVVTTHRNDVRYLYHRLKRRGLRVGRVLEGRYTSGRFQVVVANYSGVGKGVADAANRGIVIYTDPAGLFCKFGKMGLSSLRRARVFGLLPEGAQLPSPMNERVTAVFGEHSVSIPRHGFAQRPVTAVFAKSNVKSRIRHGEDQFATRRRVIWHQELRNARIAKLASVIATGDELEFGSEAPEVARALPVPMGGRVGVVVDSVEHGLAIARHLKDWPLLAGKHVHTGGLSPAEEERLVYAGRSTREMCEDVIVTIGALPQAGSFDALIRADAGVGRLPLAITQRLRAHGIDHPLLVVDLHDRHHPLARKWTRQRRAAYAADGFRTIGGPEVQDKDLEAARHEHRAPVLPYQKPRERRWVMGRFRTAKYYYEQRRERRRTSLERWDKVVKIEQIADRDHLVDCFRRLQREGGPAAGLDAVSPRDIASCDIGDIAERLSGSLKNGTWRPQPTKTVPIPKPGTTEKRILSIGVTVDRWIARAIHARLQPVLEKYYVDSSWGFRSGRNVWQMLAAMELTMQRTDRWVLAIDDIRKAFDSVRIDDVIAAHRQVSSRRAKKKCQLISEEVVQLIETLFRGHNSNREIGIDQGSPYAPDALNVLLHTAYDVPFGATNETLLRPRYADNLVHLVRTVTEGRKALSRTRRLLKKAGLALKGKDGGVFDLNAGKKAQLSGFSIRREGKDLKFDLVVDWRDRLRQSLIDVRSNPDPTKAVHEQLRGWIDAYGPALENGEAVIAEALSIAADLGFRELPEPEVLVGWCNESWRRWQTCRRRVRRRCGGKARLLASSC